MTSPESEFLGRIADAAFDLGAGGLRLSAVSVKDRRVSFADTGRTPGPPLFHGGEPPSTDRAGRREYDWQPAPGAPAHLQMAWLLADLSEWVVPMAEKQIAVTGVEAPEAAWCELGIRDGDTAYRVRIALTDRTEPLDFPGMYLLELFAEGRHREYLSAGESVVDLRGVL
ncbi:hypothetical protein ACWF94_15970 [Streptomyces sp. NPDC055078]